MLRNILARVLACWALAMFVLTILPVILFVIFLRLYREPARVRLFHGLSKYWIRIFFFLTGCRLRVKGKQYFKKGRPYVVVCNHNSFIDIPVSTPFIPGANKTIAKIELSRIPLFGLVYKTGSVLVDRKSRSSRQESYIEMKKVLQMGLHMCIYPEGTRNKTALPLGPFHDGAFKLATDTGTDVIPALIFNTKRVLPGNRTFYFWPGVIRLEFLPAVAAGEFEGHEAFRDAVHRIMSDYYTANASAG